MNPEKDDHPVTVVAGGSPLGATVVSGGGGGGRIQGLFSAQVAHEDASVGSLSRPHWIGRERKIQDRIEERAGELRNEDFKQDMNLKKITLFILFAFLAIETAAVFVIAFLQGFHNVSGFELEEVSFRILTSATITQITVMLLIAVRHLFPQKKSH